MTDLLLNFQKEISFWILANLNLKSSVLLFTNNTRSWTKCRQKRGSLSFSYCRAIWDFLHHWDQSRSKIYWALNVNSRNSNKKYLNFKPWLSFKRHPLSQTSKLRQEPVAAKTLRRARKFWRNHALSKVWFKNDIINSWASLKGYFLENSHRNVNK